jgi:non-homologous end joining protein Ku
MAAMAARAIWKGGISFGLVNIPIQVFSATQREDYTSFKGKPSTSTAAKAKGKMGMAISK